MSDKRVGIKFSPEHKQKLSEARQTRKTKESTKEKMRASMLKSNPNWKRVIDSATGIIYKSAKDAAIAINRPYTHVSSMLNGRFTNTTTLSYIRE